MGLGFGIRKKTIPDPGVKKAPDPGSATLLKPVLRMRTRIRIHFAWWIQIQEGQNDPQKYRKFKFWSTRYSLSRDEDLYCTVAWTSFMEAWGYVNCKFCSKKCKYFFSYRIFPIFGHHTQFKTFCRFPDPCILHLSHLYLFKSMLISPRGFTKCLILHHKQKIVLITNMINMY